MITRLRLFNTIHHFEFTFWGVYVWVQSLMSVDLFSIEKIILIKCLRRFATHDWDSVAPVQFASRKLFTVQCDHPSSDAWPAPVPSWRECGLRALHQINDFLLIYPDHFVVYRSKSTSGLLNRNIDLAIESIVLTNRALELWKIKSQSWSYRQILYMNSVSSEVPADPQPASWSDCSANSPSGYVRTYSSSGRQTYYWLLITIYKNPLQYWPICTFPCGEFCVYL